MEITPSAVSQTLSKMEQAGYIKRVINLKNRREIIVHLDTKGREYLSRSKEIELSIIERFYSKLGEKDSIELRRIMLKFKQIVEAEKSST